MPAIELLYEIEKHVGMVGFLCGALELSEQSCGVTGMMEWVGSHQSLAIWIIVIFSVWLWSKGERVENSNRFRRMEDKIDTRLGEIEKLLDENFKQMSEIAASTRGMEEFARSRLASDIDTKIAAINAEITKLKEKVRDG